MKITLALLAVACTALGGCVAVPVDPAPVVYAAPPPPPVVVVRPYGYYGYGYYSAADRTGAAGARKPRA